MRRCPGAGRGGHLRILFVSTWFPCPPDNGSKIRVNHLLQALCERHEVNLVTFMPTIEEAVHIPALRAVCAQVDVVHHDPFRLNRTKALLGLVSLRPSHVVAGHSPDMAEMVVRAEERQPCDLIIASTTVAAQYTKNARQGARLLEEHNFMPRWMEEQYRAQRSPARKAMRWLTWKKGLRYERGLYRQFTACTMVSERDRQAMVEAMPSYSGRVAVIPNGVDLEHYRPGLAAPSPDTLIFTGALTYSANSEAMRFFIGEILPLIRRQCPDATLAITGRNAGVDQSWLPADGSVRLTGYMEDVRPAVAAAWACVAPLRTGGGTRLKILEAMALGTPVIATSKGAEGLDVTPGHDILIADEPAALAAHVVRLLGDPGLRSRLAESGRRLVEEKYGWSEIGRRFRQLVESTAADSGGKHAG